MEAEKSECGPQKGISGEGAKIGTKAYLAKANRSPRSDTLSWLLINADLVLSDVSIAVSNEINANSTKLLTSSVAEMSFIKLPPKPVFELVGT